MESIDYYKLYCNFADPDFLETLQLDASEAEVIRLMTEQTAEFNRLYIPKLQIEGLVHASNSPYQALRTLHTLKEKRIIFYELLETVPDAERPAAIIDKVRQQANEYVKNEGRPGNLTTPPEKEDVKLIDPSNKLKVYDRYALLNIEYPVTYFCLKEEMDIQTMFDTATLNICYSMIRRNALADALIKCHFPAILEFLQYVQSVFGQELTQHVDTAITQEEAAEQIAQEHNRIERGDSEAITDEDVNDDR